MGDFAAQRHHSSISVKNLLRKITSAATLLLKCSSQAGRPSDRNDKALDTQSAYQDLLSSQNTGRTLRTAHLTCPGVPQQLATPEEKGFIQVNGYIFGAFCPAWLPPLCSASAPGDCREYPNPSVPQFPPAFLQIPSFWQNSISWLLANDVPWERPLMGCWTKK